MFVLFAALLSRPAHATTCEDEVLETLTCTSIVQGKLDPGPWAMVRRRS